MTINPTFKNILVTGATGFLGSRLVERLSQLNQYNIFATGRDIKKGSKLENYRSVNFIQADLTNKKLVNTLCKNMDIVVHSAALSSLWGTYDAFYDANILSTQNIVNGCMDNKVKRLVHISTPSIYPQKLGQDIFDIKENFIPKTFISTYAQTKYDAEKIINKAHNNGLETIILRPRGIYGRGDFTIMPRILRTYHAGKLKIIGDGENIVDVTNVSNVVNAILLSIKANHLALGNAFNITDGKPVKMWEVVRMVLDELNLKWEPTKIPYKVVDKIAWGLEKWALLTNSKQEPMLTRASVSIAACSTTLNIDKAKKLLGYKPEYTLEMGIEEFSNWWLEQ
ncbi:MAG: NAD-dependent epimerase/dehydratase family protein [Saprospiraceae bacterium]|nr:NAD-dependent epimerase/dehydratase family protein [Saprospiraceae bacterium]